MTADTRRAALDQARAAVGAARGDIAQLALDAERIPLPEGRSLATALHEAVRALDAAEEHIAVAALRARRVAAAKEAPMTTDEDRVP